VKPGNVLLPGGFWKVYLSEVYAFTKNKDNYRQVFSGF